MIPTPEFWIKKLDLVPHPEGGYYREVYRSPFLTEIKTPDDRYEDNRNPGTSIYYLLEKDNFSGFHRLKSDEIWHFYTGSDIIIHQIDPSGNYTKILLGTSDPEVCHLQHIIPAGIWFSAELADKSGYGLAGCTVFPGFDFRDFELGSEKELYEQFGLEVIRGRCRLP